jgi:ribosomal protein S18 acetylase RimI-like enzyme
LQSVKVQKLKSRQELEQTLGFLKKHRSINLYLHEGITCEKRYWVSFSLRTACGAAGVFHTKNGEYFHLFLLPGTGAEAAVALREFLCNKYPAASVFFGEREGIEEFLREACIGVLKRREYYFMEVEKKDFTPFLDHLCVRPLPESAPLLLPLQVGYEMEELGVSSSEIQASKTLLALRKRLEQGEVTALFHGGEPAAVASVNARFGDTCQIGSVYVAPKYRGMGYGRSVVSSHVMGLFDEYERIALFVDRRNEKAVRLYHGLGFRKAGELIQAHIKELQGPERSP